MRHPSVSGGASHEFVHAPPTWQLMRHPLPPSLFAFVRSASSPAPALPVPSLLHATVASAPTATIAVKKCRILMVEPSARTSARCFPWAGARRGEPPRRRILGALCVQKREL